MSEQYYALAEVAALRAEVARLTQRCEAEGERIFERVCDQLGLDRNHGDVDSADAADWIIAAVKQSTAKSADTLGRMECDESGHRG